MAEQQEEPEKPKEKLAESPGRELGKVLREEIEDQDSRGRRRWSDAWKEAKKNR